MDSASGRIYAVAILQLHHPLMERKLNRNLPRTSYSTTDYLQFVAGAKAYLDGVSARLNEVASRSSCWPTYMWEEAEYFNLNPPDELAQAIVNLQTDIGNVNLRLDALLLAMNSS